MSAIVVRGLDRAAVAAVAAVAVIAAVTAAAAVGTAAAASAPIARVAVHTLSQNRAAAHTVAERRLAHALLPAGATQVGTDPEAVTDYEWLGGPAADTPSSANVADLHRFFRVPERPGALFAWLGRHRPRGSTLSSKGRAVVHGRTVDRSISFAFRGVRDTIAQEGVGFEMTDARGGGTALRVESWAMWFVPRPAFERVPDDVFAVAVSLDRPGAKEFPVNTITDPGSVRKLADYVNSLRVVQPQDTVGCSPATSTRLDLRFLFTVGATPVARAVDDGCFALDFSVLGRRGPKLSGASAGLGDLLWRLHDVPVCTPAQLSGSATLPERSSLNSSDSTMQLRLTNTSQTVCGLMGFPRIQLRQANGQPLRTHTTSLEAYTPAVILAPNTFAETDLEWGATAQCDGSTAATINLTPPGLQSTFTIAVGSPANPVQPCEGAMYVSPVEAAAAS